jgi:hypothetical protein
MCPEQSVLTPLSGGPHQGRRSRQIDSSAARNQLTTAISVRASPRTSRRSQMIKTMIFEVSSSSYGPEGCRGLMTEGSGADGPDVAGGVVRVAPIDFEAASPRNESQPEMSSFPSGSAAFPSRSRQTRGRPWSGRLNLLLRHPVRRFATSEAWEGNPGYPTCQEIVPRAWPGSPHMAFQASVPSRNHVPPPRTGRGQA